jgi:hypothetical protein
MMALGRKAIRACLEEIAASGADISTINTLQNARDVAALIPGESNGLGSVYFNILPPGSTGEAIYNGATDGLDATGIVLPKDGDYTIRVYQLGDDADSGKTTAFMISVGIM